MVDQLLDVARNDNLVGEAPEFIDFGAHVQLICSSVSSLFDDKSLSIEQYLEQNLIVNIQASAAEKIIVNLLTNAVKYTHRGGAIEVKCQSKEDYVELLIKDNGIGIVAEQHSKIFERFVRIHNKEEEHIPGAGIGLALVKELVERFNGSISVKSQLNIGSEFLIKFPVVKADTQVISTQSLNNNYILQEKRVVDEGFMNDKARPSEIAEELSVDNLDTTEIEGKPTILIVEDHPEVQAYIKEGLSDGFHCIVASDGDEGIKKAMELIPDVVITDLMMPIKNGFELSRVLRADMKTSHIPIIMLTAKGDDESRLQAWKTDIDEYMNKPFNLQELKLRVRSLLNIRLLMSQRISTSIKLAPQSDGLETKKDIDVQSALIKVDESTRFIGVCEKDKRFMSQLEKLLEQHYQNPDLKVEQICPELAMSERQLNRKMKALLAQTFSNYLRSYRLRKGAGLLKQQVPITLVAMESGFSTQSYFSRCFKAQYGLSPKEYTQLNIKQSE